MTTIHIPDFGDLLDLFRHKKPTETAKPATPWPKAPEPDAEYLSEAEIVNAEASSEMAVLPAEFAAVPEPAEVETEPAPVSVPEIPAATAAETSTHMSILSTILDGTGDYFKGFFDAFKGDAASLETGVVTFVKTDVGKLAVDAVQYASTLTGQSNDQLRDAAVAQLKADLIKTGHDAESIAASTLNLLIEAAYTYTKGKIAGLTATAVTAAVAAA